MIKVLLTDRRSEKRVFCEYHGSRRRERGHLLYFSCVDMPFDRVSFSEFLFWAGNSYHFPMTSYMKGSINDSVT